MFDGSKPLFHVTLIAPPQVYNQAYFAGFKKKVRWPSRGRV